MTIPSILPKNFVLINCNYWIGEYDLVNVYIVTEELDISTAKEEYKTVHNLKNLPSIHSPKFMRWLLKSNYVSEAQYEEVET